ncbi:MAG: hypothetical protein [Caudoviricetes sp.]|nr:MAG: hypothetical protein [Caudoviricetes sp.]
MTIKDAYQQFLNYIDFIQPESLYDLETIDLNHIKPELHGNLNRIREDSLGQSIQIGDLVAYGKIGGYKGLSKGFVLGYTNDGYRVARIQKNREDNYYYCSELQTPGDVILINENRR